MKDIRITTNTVCRSFYNEEAFGERWVLEGWAENDAKRTVLFDTHDVFEAKAEAKDSVKNEAEQLTADVLKNQLGSTNAAMRARASELLWAQWNVGGGSRRSVERAMDVTAERAARLVFEFPATVRDLRLEQGKIRYVQLRIEPLGTNAMDKLVSNTIDWGLRTIFPAP